MKEALIILAITASVLLTAVAATKHETKPKIPQCTCPTLEELLKEKVEKEELARKQRALERRQKIKDALHLD